MRQRGTAPTLRAGAHVRRARRAPDFRPVGAGRAARPPRAAGPRDGPCPRPGRRTKPGRLHPRRPGPGWRCRADAVAGQTTTHSRGSGCNGTRRSCARGGAGCDRHPAGRCVRASPPTRCPARVRGPVPGPLVHDQRPLVVRLDDHDRAHRVCARARDLLAPRMSLRHGGAPREPRARWRVRGHGGVDRWRRRCAG